MDLEQIERQMNEQFAYRGWKVIVQLVKDEDEPQGFRAVWHASEEEIRRIGREAIGMEQLPSV